MDPKTVIFLLSLNLISIGGLLILIGRRMPEPAGLRGFATGALVFGCAYLLRLALGYTSSTALTVVADAGMVFATLCFASGMLQFSGRAPIRGAVLAACVGSYAALASAAIVASPEGGRHVAINLFLGGAYLALGALALAGARRETRTLATPMRVLALLVGVLGLATFARGLGVLTGDAEFLYSGVASQVYYGYGAVVTVMLGPNLLWMVFVRLNDRLALLATRDPLTQLLNRNGLDEVVQRHFGARPLRPLVLMQVDVDHFKRVNDSHGHAVGDAVLRAVADTLASHARGGDFIARLGGEEFLVGCVGADVAQARQLAERLRLAVSGCRHALPDGGTVACTVSIGVSGVLSDRSGWEAALRQADRALYAAKAAGRDRVETAPAEASEPGPNP